MIKRKKIICGCRRLNPGLQLKNVFKLIDKVDSELEETLDFAFFAPAGLSDGMPDERGDRHESLGDGAFAGYGLERPD